MDDARDLLDREIGLLWGTDDCGRTEPGPVLSVAVPGDGTDETVPDAFPRERLDGSDGFELRRCRSFVLDRPSLGVMSTDAPPGMRLVGSDQPAEVARLHRSEAQWSAAEWSVLTSRRWGPFVAAVDPDDHVLALCFSSRLGGGAAEAGVWTDPDHRGRGLAGAVTARWAALVGEQCDAIFYSARPDNHASLAVARRLGARPLGTIWQLWGGPGATA